MPEPRIGAIVLAAGRGTRFGAEPKLLAEYAGKPLVRHVTEAAVSSSARPVVVVLGAHSSRVKAAIDGLELILVENPRYAEGLSTSLHAGISALAADTDAAIVLLADMPRVTSHHVEALADAYRRAEPRPSAVVPVAGGQRGNPVLLDLDHLLDKLAGLSGDRGAGVLLAARSDVLEVAMDASVCFDVDTPEALA